MNFEESMQLINSTYVLTANEKKDMIKKAQTQDPNFLAILERYKSTKNVQKFYEELKECQLVGVGSCKELLKTHAFQR